MIHSDPQADIESEKYIPNDFRKIKRPVMISFAIPYGIFFGLLIMAAGIAYDSFFIWVTGALIYVLAYIHYILKNRR
jgi:hypothetical protein